MSTTLCAYGCNNPAQFFNHKQIGRCSYHPGKCESIRARMKESIKRTHAAKSDAEKILIKERRAATNLSRHGVVNVSSSLEVRAKREQTFLDRFGTTNPSYNLDIIAKIKDKMPLILEKRKITNKDKFGTESYASTEEFKSRRMNTWMEKYGVDNPTKHPDILDKVLQGQDHRRTNKIMMLDGQMIRVQGYEPIVIRDLIKSGIPESEIICDRKRIPKIPYVIDDKHRIYYPDIYIPRYNLLIEVKSLYTWKRYKDINLAKVKAAKAAGFDIRVVVRSSDQVRTRGR